MRVLGIIVNYRVAPMAIEATRSLLRDLEGLDAHVTVIDNDSQDGSADALRAAIEQNGWESRVRFHASPRNGGFGAGNNIAINEALAASDKPDFIFLVNPDAVVQPGTVRGLLDFFAENPQAGVAGTRLFDPDGTPSASCFRFPSLLGELESGIKLGPVSRLLERWVVPMVPPRQTREVDWVSGSSCMFRREAFERAGVFDEGFFLYFEEVDLCRRVHNAGFTIHYVTETSVEHVQAAATGVKGSRRRPAYWFESRRRYFEKHHGKGYFVFATLTWALGASVDRVRRTLTGKPLDGPSRLLRDQLEYLVRSVVRS
jgi:GT2 family glycosyltransferase